MIKNIIKYKSIFQHNYKLIHNFKQNSYFSTKQFQFLDAKYIQPIQSYKKIGFQNYLHDLVYKKNDYISLQNQEQEILLISQKQKNPQAYFNLSLIELTKSTSNYQLIEEFLLQAIELDKNNLTYYKFLACVQVSNQKFIEAEESFKKAIEINDKDPEIYAFFAQLQIQHQNNYTEAEQNLYKALNLKEDDTYYSTLGQIQYENLNKYDEAIINCEKSIEITQKNYNYYLDTNYHLAKIYSILLKNEKNEKNQNLYQQKVNQNYSLYYLNQGKMHLSRQAASREVSDMIEHKSKAYQYLRKAIEMDDQNHQAYVELTSIYRNFEDINNQQRENYLKKAIKIEQKPDYYYKLGQLQYQNQQKYKEAEQNLLKAISLGYNHSDIYSTLGKLQFEHLSKYQEGEQNYLKSLEMSYPFGNYLELGIYQYKLMQKYEESEINIKKSIHLSQNIDAYYDLAIVQIEYLNKYEEGEQTLLKAISIFEENYSQSLVFYEFVEKYLKLLAYYQSEYFNKQEESLKIIEKIKEFEKFKLK